MRPQSALGVLLILILIPCEVRGQSSEPAPPVEPGTLIRLRALNMGMERNVRGRLVEGRADSVILLWGDERSAYATPTITAAWRSRGPRPYFVLRHMGIGMALGAAVGGLMVGLNEPAWWQVGAIVGAVPGTAIGTAVGFIRPRDRWEEVELEGWVR